MSHILVIGASGMAGHVIAHFLREANHTVDTLSGHNKMDDDTIILDVTNKEEFETFLDKNHYDIIINSIGLLVKHSEDRKDLASYINAYLPHFLEYKFKETDTKIIHLSTDCVFSGKNAPYNEQSMFDGELFYDRSKALGEIVNSKDLTFRMSIIGPDMQENGIGLFNWFCKQTGNIFGYTNAIWNGITTIELAKGINSAIEQDLTGLYHLVPNDNISKYELITLFVKIFDRTDITVSKDESVTLDKTLVNTRNDFNFTVITYPQMLTEMKEWINSHPHLYPHYLER